NCLGYRVSHGGRAICYVTDNELYVPESEHYDEEYVERLADFARDADMLITDATYTDEEYPKKMGYGHSAVSQVADLAGRARAKALYLFHHDPDQSDDLVDAKLARARERLAATGAPTIALAPTEGTEVEL